MEKYFYVYLIAVNIAALAACAYDKRMAVKHRRRISEKTLLSLSAIGGAFGFYIGMYLFRHKTRHPKFYFGIPILCILWGLLIAYLFSSGIFKI